VTRVALRDRPLRILGDRPLGFIARNLVQPGNYRALVNMVRRYPHPLDAAQRYFRARGSYPVQLAVRTPAATMTPTLWSYHDMITLQEMFCREDYGVTAPPPMVVDIGSNIGLSALYFLTRGPAVRCRLYEPVARNVERLRQNLAGFEGRYELEQVAVADFDGEATFGVEDTGRYGGLGVSTETMTTVRCRHINAVLEEALAVAGTIAVLKIDVEGHEAKLIAAIRPELLARIELIYAEAVDIVVPTPDGFAATAACDTIRLRNVALVGRP
jgi:FkbM family methyltransferase